MMKKTISTKIRSEIKKLKKQKHLSIREIAKRCAVGLDDAMTISGTAYERRG